MTEHENVYFQDMLAGITNHLFGLIYSLNRNNQFNKYKHLTIQIEQVRLLMREKIDSSLSLQDIPEELGMKLFFFPKIIQGIYRSFSCLLL